MFEKVDRNILFFQAIESCAIVANKLVKKIRPLMNKR